MSSGASRSRNAVQRGLTPSSLPPVLSVALLNAINNAGQWSDVVKVLCTHLGLPNLATRSGLKAIHTKFTEYFTKLDAIYIAAQARGMERLMGGIVGVWVTMCADAILRDKLSQAGLITKILPLLDLDSTRHLALQALSSMTHHGGMEARMQIARRNHILVKIMQDHPNDGKVQELAVATLSHSTIAVVGTEHPPEPRLPDEFVVRMVLECTVNALRDPRASGDLIQHAFPLLTCATLHFASDSQSVDGLLPLLIATLGSSNVCNRCIALGALIRVTSGQVTTVPQPINPDKLIEALRQPFPEDIAAAIMRYGAENCESVMTLRASAEYTGAMLHATENHDLIKLGRSLANVILLCEFSITEGTFHTLPPNPNPRPVGPVSLGFQFTRWTDALQHCANAIRALGSDADLDTADTLEIKYFIIRSRLSQAVAVAESAIARNPELAYAYYAIGLGLDNVKGLRAAKKGLKCTHLTPFLRNHLRWRAVEHAGIFGMELLQLAHVGDREYATGIAFLESAWEDARAFLAEAPPDNRHLQAVINWYIVLEIAFKGPKLTTNFDGLKPIREKLNMSSRILTFLGHTIEETPMHLVRQLILDTYHTSSLQWQAFVRRFDELSTADPAHVPSGEREDNLAAWLDDIEREGGDMGAHFCPRPPINVGRSMLYRCSWCANPSAVLKKCGRCGNTRYCDSICQKKHWPNHKSVCRRA